MIDIMTELDQKYPETYEEWARAKGEPAYLRKGITTRDATGHWTKTRMDLA